MCSVTIFTVGGAVVVTMNRDEAVSRPQETPPQAEAAGFYPKDTGGGGTWCGISPNGEVYCLLNRYEDTDIKPQLSRGAIIPILLNGGALPDYDNFDSFSLIRFSVNDKGGALTAWDGLDAWEERISNLPYFFSSSGFKREEVLPYRQKLFADFTKNNGQPDVESIFAFHQTVDKRREYGIFAEREMSHTKSILQFVIEPDLSARYRYFRRDGLTASGKIQ